MSEVPTRPALRERYDRRQQRVVDAAAALFSERGFQQTTMADLSEATGLTIGGLYHYIGSKDELLYLLCDNLMRPMLDRAREIAAEPGVTPERTLRTLVRAWVAHVEARRHSLRVFQQERHVIEREPRWREIRESRKQFERLLDDVLARGEADGSLAFDDRRIALLALLGMVNYMPQWYSPDGPLDAERIADGYCDLLLERHATRRVTRPD